jgi:hypothetical protein
METQVALTGGCASWVRAERKSLLPRLWLDAGDEPQMVRMALAVGDQELAQSAAEQADRRAQLNPDVASLLLSMSWIPSGTEPSATFADRTGNRSEGATPRASAIDTSM